ncbi:hypothetical protein K0504_12055 [Neiella marina]|uniref:Uncharacterized protein n=1 Tax=Neiella holothuriorum TaxID=2870530 RepID=A0ABS7EHG8_9GAMM|nr:hypothetical protein [Neiella holothuriorum]MBW8191770.1 hypothetical protein [Neiella holothuriorum]
MDYGLLLHVVVVTGLIVFIAIGAIAMGLILWSTVNGIREMGRCRNSNQLGMDVSFSDLHGDAAEKPKVGGHRA